MTLIVSSLKKTSVHGNLEKAGSILTIQLLTIEMRFSKFPVISIFRIGSIAPNENLKTPEIFKYLKTLNFLCQALKDFA